MAASGTARILSLVATIVRVACAVIAGVIVVHALFVLFEANPENGLVSFAASWRDSFGWFTRDLFTPSDPKIAEAINAGLAALIWVVVGSLLSKLIVRLAPEGSSKKADA
ncbi:hypothetical protein DQ244_02060 [Blastococcus sp. TBT05-19]|uniref:hypothetical protein n=1 Tax=Blastococcus sp. TBT05-19 TaxID=2250581 RepID=UPI000DE8864F|nr:hypothetical protein [Blastococcus sp. TBT05-19]RBY94165.1 hypothetical protein DQ244_02060 [Blastococcus sp. TBT05-19]